jgi:hypothetical protein
MKLTTLLGARRRIRACPAGEGPQGPHRPPRCRTTGNPDVGTLLVDAGYWSEANDKAVATLPVKDALIVTTKVG